MDLTFYDITDAPNSTIKLEKGEIMDETGAACPLEVPLCLKEIFPTPEEKAELTKQTGVFELTKITVAYPIIIGQPMWQNGEFSCAKIPISAEDLIGILIEKGSVIGILFKRTFLFLKGRQYGQSHYEYEVRDFESGPSKIVYTIYRLSKR